MLTPVFFSIVWQDGRGKEGTKAYLVGATARGICRREKEEEGIIGKMMGRKGKGRENDG